MLLYADPLAKLTVVLLWSFMLRQLLCIFFLITLDAVLLYGGHQLRNQEDFFIETQLHVRCRDVTLRITSFLLIFWPLYKKDHH